MRSKLVYVFIVLMIVFKSCDCSSKKPDQKKPVLTNIVILLDLSDRILATGQIEKDIDICSNLFESFINIQKDKLYFNSNDKFKIVVADQNSQLSNSQLYSIQDSLNFDMGQIPIKEKKHIKNSLTDFRTKLESLYKEAKISNNPNDFKGANILKYFNEHAGNDFNLSTENDSYLFIITDGYQYVEGKNYKPLDKWDPVTNLDGVKVNIFEVMPRESRDEKEFDRIQYYWTDWMQNMNAEYVEIYSSTALNEIKSRIKNILNTKKNTQKNEGQFNENKEVKKNENTSNVLVNENVTGNSLSWSDEISVELDTKIQGTSNLCEQTEYTNLKIKISGNKGQQVTDQKLEQLKIEINDVPNKCKEAY